MPEPEVLIDQMSQKVRVAFYCLALKGIVDGSLVCRPIAAELSKPTVSQPGWLYVLRRTAGLEAAGRSRKPPGFRSSDGWAGLASRSFYALCKACPNLYLDTSRYALFRGLEAFCDKVGARQLVYGSGMPFIAPGVSMTTITHAEIDAGDKAMIAAGNLERLLAEVTL
jgi:hypothetical protein